VIKETPFEERPRERLHEHGSAILSDAELVALLLRTGTPVRGVMEIARAVVRENGGLLGLLDARKEDLVREGLGEAKAASILAAVEIGRRLAKATCRTASRSPGPAAMASYLSLRYRVRDQEVMGASTSTPATAWSPRRRSSAAPSRGRRWSPGRCSRRAFAGCVRAWSCSTPIRAATPRPSLEDLAFTRRMAEAGDAVGIRLADHLILGGTGRWVSLKERGAW
jgi:DNA repair protein RadC